MCIDLTNTTFISYNCGLFLLLTAALEVTQRIMENKDDWSSLFKPSDFFQKYKYVMHTNSFVLKTCTRYVALFRFLYDSWKK